MKNRSKSGFTLIELIIVIAILAFVAVVGIHNYGNIREIQAKKVNTANIKRVYHALSTYETINREQGESGYFGGFDSLIDVDASGKWTGTEGGFDWGEWTVTSRGGTRSLSIDARKVHNSMQGIYDGSWKVLGAVYNASGAGSGNVASLEEAMDQNKGTRNTGLYKQLGIYYLTGDDVDLLRNAGITYYYMHNPSTQQAYGAANRNPYCTVCANENDIWRAAAADGGRKIMSGGPGFRPDMSAFYPVDLTNGLPVAVVVPTSTLYDDFGYGLGLDNAAPSQADGEKALSSVKLIAFGIGRNAECVSSQFGLGEAPVNPYYDKTNYRQYVALFAIKAGGQGVPSSCRLAGVVDCAGNTYKQAEYGVNWSTKLGN